MTDDLIETLIEEAVSAYRERTTSGKILPSPAWWDLPAGYRAELFQRQMQGRILERTIAPDSLSATVRSVLRRIESISSKGGVLWKQQAAAYPQPLYQSAATACSR